MKNNFLIRLGRPVSGLRIRKCSSAGRNSTGSIIVWQRGGGLLKFHRQVDYHRDHFNIPALVRALEFDSSRCTYLALICYRHGALSYVLAAEGVRINDILMSTNFYSRRPGFNFPLEKFSVGSFLFALELKNGSGSVIARSAGTSALILKHYEKYVLIRLRSGEQRLFPSNANGTYGIASNIFRNSESLNKAGDTRKLGFRPHVRGVAINPVDHAHGGDTSGGRFSSTPWGRLTKGKPTKLNNQNNKFVICTSRTTRLIKKKK